MDKEINTEEIVIEGVPQHTPVMAIYKDAEDNMHADIADGASLYEAYGFIKLWLQSYEQDLLKGFQTADENIFNDGR